MLHGKQIRNLQGTDKWKLEVKEKIYATVYVVRQRQIYK